MTASKQRPTGDVLAVASGRWPEILQDLGGLRPDQLTDTHQPCPACAVNGVALGHGRNVDRYRWDRDDGPGGWFCSQCGGKQGTGGAGSGLDLLMRVRGWELRQAIEAVGQHLGLAPIAANNRRSISKRHRCPDKPPADAPDPDMGGVVAHWCYRDSQGEPLYWIQRYNKRDGSKGFIHRVWLDGRWHRPSTRKDGFTCEWPTPRPVYRLPELVKRPDDPVLVVEGEKAADAAADLFPDWVVVSWSGGSKSIGTVDWQPLAGRNVTLWPDNDAPGQKAMLTIAARLVAMGGTVAMVRLPEAFPDAWDVADPMPEGFTAEQILREWSESVRISENPLAAAAAPAAPAGPPPEAPYRVLGWDDLESRRAVWVQCGELRAAARITTDKKGLQSIAPLTYWEALFPARNGANWDCALSHFIHDEADRAGCFRPTSLRGRGVWRDGDSTVWNLGDRLMVDGTAQTFDWRGEAGHAYQPGQRLPIDPDGPVLSDEHGAAILNLLHHLMPWEESLHGVLFVGHAVMASVSGAMEKRPPLQVTGHKESGKTTVMDTWRTLQGAKPKDANSPFVIYESKSTAAGIMQRSKSDALPLFIDESEEGEDGKRAGHVLLARLSYDGLPMSKGTTHQTAIQYAMRSSVALAGINAPLPNPADASRFAIIQPKKDDERFKRFKQERDRLISPDIGQSLVRRTVRNLSQLLQDIPAMIAELEARGKITTRRATVYGTLFACARSITTTAPLTPESAGAWLDSIGWAGLSDQELEEASPTREAEQCRDALLNYRIAWKEKESPVNSTTVSNLLWMVAVDNGSKDAARKALGAEGIKYKDGKVAVARRSPVFATISGGRWGNGSHVQQLKMLEGAELLPQRERFAGFGADRGARFPYVPVNPAEDES